MNEDIDLDKDGKVSEKEEELYKEKIENQVKIVWVCLVSMMVTLISILFIIPEARLESIGDKLDWYWIIVGSIVGAYIGIKQWLNK